MVFSSLLFPSQINADLSDGYGGFRILELGAKNGNESIGDIKFDPTNNNLIYFATPYNGKIYKYNLQTEVAEAVFEDVNVNNMTTQFVISSDGHFLYSTTDAGYVRKVNILPSDPNYKQVEVVVDKDTSDTAEVDVASPAAIVIKDSSHKLYIGDAYQIYTYDLNTTEIELIAGMPKDSEDTKTCGNNVDLDIECDGIGTAAKLNDQYYMEWKDESNIVFYEKATGWGLRNLNINTRAVTAPFRDPNQRRHTGFHFKPGTNYFFTADQREVNSQPFNIYKYSYGDYQIKETFQIPTINRFSNAYHSGVDISPNGRTLAVANTDMKQIVLININPTAPPVPPTPDTTGPVITNIHFHPVTFDTISNIYVTFRLDWTTNESSTSAVIGGTQGGSSTLYTWTTNGLTTNHSVLIGDPMIWSWYPNDAGFKIRSVDGWGNETITPFILFKDLFSTNISSRSYGGNLVNAESTPSSETPVTTEEEKDAVPVTEKSTVERVVDSIQTVIQGIINKTPESIAYTFPYLLFLSLIFMAYIFYIQIKNEARANGAELLILNSRQAINKQKDNFIMLVSHYLRTPATLIISGAEVAGAKNIEVEADKLKDDVELIVGSLENQKKLNKSSMYKIFFSPFLVIPVIFVGLLGFGVTYVFINSAKTDFNAYNLFAEVLLFTAGALVFASQYRKKKRQNQNILMYDENIKQQEEIAKERNKVLSEIQDTLKRDLNEIEKSLGKNNDETIREGIRRFDELFERISFITALTEESIKDEKVQYSLNDLVNKAIKETKTKIPVEIVGDRVMDKRNKKMAKTAIKEIIENAVKFSKTGSNVKVAIGVEGGKGAISVTNFGKTISQKDKKMLFTPFYRPDSALNFNYEGIGLGMYITKSIVEILDGSITVKSRFGKTKVKVII